MLVNFKNAARLDAAEQVYFTRELERIIEENYPTEYPDYNCRALIPTDFSDGAGTKKITYRMYDKVGTAKIINSYANDFEAVDVKFTEYSSTVKPLGNKYGYTVQEARESRQANKPLEQFRAEAARQAIQAEEHFIALFGNDDYGILGLFTNPNVPTMTFTADGTGASTLWSNKNSEQILRDLNDLTWAAYYATKGKRVSDTILLPHGHYAKIATTPFNGTLSSASILDTFLKMNPQVKQVLGMWELDHTHNTRILADFAFAYQKNPSIVSLRIPVDFEQFVIDKGIETEVKCHETMGGVLNIYPLASCYAEGL